MILPVQFIRTHRTKYKHKHQQQQDDDGFVLPLFDVLKTVHRPAGTIYFISSGFLLSIYNIV